MSHQSSSGEAASPSKSSQRTFLDDIMLTFSNPVAWLLIVALIITWSAVAVVLFDLLDYKTLTGKCLEITPNSILFHFNFDFSHM